MSLRSPVLVLLLLFLGAPPAGAADWSLEDFIGRRSEWEGFPVGSRVHVRRRNTLEVPGAEEPTVRTDEIQRELVEVREDAIVLEVSHKVGQTWRKVRQVLPRRDLSKVETERLGEALIRVGEASFPVMKTRVKRPGPRGPEEMVLWENPRHGILRIEVLAPDVSTVTATDLGRRVKVGERTIEARAFVLETGGQGPKRQGTLLLSQAVPEAMVAQDVRAPGDPPPFRAEAELLDFHVPEPEKPEKGEDEGGAATEAPPAPPAPER